ncbi:HpcH/HpaI aldolase/citrate lyase family protein [Rhizobium paknamense]|uniref:Citrate lyase subunit beta/citryl-CoA lyase n=1 Tax=Rhizobium paknamense TaxID=1206817 RepID=A0ABU0IGN4_9HYPH|nr:CoA ester lyase [Rhizobium paknamense]MDQ0457414.1 citrate lyase subunit beta/citryl-CoA lyase [Rhizobium paknamense]
MTSRPAYALCRSLLSVPAINAKALEKSRVLGCDGIILDLEDSVAADRKAEARQALRGFFAQGRPGDKDVLLRINGAGDHQAEDLALAAELDISALVLPKVEAPGDLTRLREAMGEGPRLWAMIETPKAVLHIAAIAEAASALGVDGFIVGLNDLRKESRVPAEPERRMLLPWLMQVVLAARAYGLSVVDSVSNDFRDIEAFARECAQGRAMGFDGKMLIHPAQIEAANRHFSPSEAEIAEAREIVAAFAAPEAAHLNVINHQGRMIERLHADQAKVLLQKLSHIQDRKAQIP